MFTMYDDVDLDLIPVDPHAVAAYVNGEFANRDDAEKRFPHARILAISVTGIEAHECYDVEAGDYSIDDVPSLFKAAKDGDIWRPCFYADLSNMPAVKDKLNTVVEKRDDVRLWVAYYNETPDLPSGYDAHQFTKTALGRSLDESICASDFFRAAERKDADTSHKATVTLDGDTWHIEKAE